MRILVLGGFGNFGARICRALAGDAAVKVFVAGRTPAAAPADLPALGVECVAVDITPAALPACLAALKPGTVIHCAGPFQGQDYHVARSVLAAGAHYIDLADGRDFVAGFAAAMDADARRAGRLATTGASTLPALSSAVVDAHLDRFSTLQCIDSVIAPGQRAARGRATLAAVLSYAGMPFETWEAGAWRTVRGWRQVTRVDLPLGTRLAAPCDVPDLALFPTRYRDVRDIRFRAALELPIQHRALSVFAALRAHGWRIDPQRVAPLMERMAGWLDRFGSDAGCMTVTLSGRDRQQQPLELRWEIVAPNGHGPEIPCMPAVLLARRLANGEPLATGAMPCMGLLRLADFTAEFARWGMRTSTR